MMRSGIKILIAVALSLTLLVIGLRLASRRRAIPCPFWLDWLLENPYMDTVASARSTIERAQIQPGMKVLDVGCGPGRLTIPAAQRVGPEGAVVALDIQPQMRQRTSERVLQSGLKNVRLVEAGAGEGTFKEDGFDRALLVTVLGEIPDRVAALTEIYKALKPGGILSVTEVLPDPHYQTRDTVSELSHQVGFADAGYTGNIIAYTANFKKTNRPLDPADQPG